MWNGGLGTCKQGTMLQRQKKKTKMRVVVDILLVQKLTNFRQLIKHICIKNDNINSSLKLHREVYF